MTRPVGLFAILCSAVFGATHDVRPGLRLCSGELAGETVETAAVTTRLIGIDEATFLFRSGEPQGETKKTRVSGAFYVVSTAEKIELHSAVDGALVRNVARAPSAPVEIPAALSRDGEWLFTAAHDFKYVRLANTRTGEISRDGFGGGKYGALLTFSPNSRYALFYRSDTAGGGFVLEDLLATIGSRYLIYGANPSETQQYLVTDKGDVVNLGTPFTAEIPSVQSLEGDGLGTARLLPVSLIAGAVPPPTGADDVLDFRSRAAALRALRGQATPMDRADSEISALSYGVGVLSPGGTFALVLRRSIAPGKFHLVLDVIGLFANSRVATLDWVSPTHPQAIEMDPSERLVAVGGAGVIQLFDIGRPERPTHVLRRDDMSPVVSLSFLDGKRLVATYGTGDVVRWDL